MERIDSGFQQADNFSGRKLKKDNVCSLMLLHPFISVMKEWDALLNSLIPNF